MVLSARTYQIRGGGGAARRRPRRYVYDQYGVT